MFIRIERLKKFKGIWSSLVYVIRLENEHLFTQVEGSNPSVPFIITFIYNKNFFLLIIHPPPVKGGPMYHMHPSVRRAHPNGTGAEHVPYGGGYSFFFNFTILH